MKYPNAYHGTKKLFIGAFFAVIAAVLIIVSSVLLALPGAKNQNSTEVAVSAGLTIGAGAVSILSFIFELIGLIQARRDERNFGNALWCVFFGIIASLISIGLSFVKADWVQYTVTALEAISRACSLFVIVYILTGISVLTDRLGENRYAARGGVIRGILIVLFLIAIAMRLISTFIRLNDDVTRAMGFVAIGAGAIEFLAYIWYFFYLAKAPRKLSK